MNDGSTPMKAHRGSMRRREVGVLLVGDDRIRGRGTLEHFSMRECFVITRTIDHQTFPVLIKVTSK
jgi:hypothetical protein